MPLVGKGSGHQILTIYTVVTSSGPLCGHSLAWLVVCLIFHPILGAISFDKSRSLTALRIAEVDKAIDVLFSRLVLSSLR